jgi:cytochrome c-type biogenesis protein CcmH/NrfG
VAIRLLVRLGIALACVGGVVVSLIARDSRTTEQRAFAVYIETKDPQKTLKLLDDAKPLNPDFAIEVGEARLKKGQGVTILRKAVAKEPENAELWVRLAQQQVVAGDRAGAQRSYARARELAPLLPPTGPPPGV